MPTNSEIVAICVTSHAGADRNLAKAYRHELATIDAIESGLAQGMVSDGMLAKQFIWGHREALGMIAAAAKKLADLHPIGTQLAKDNGVDLGKITEAGGIDLPQPEITVLDGSGR